MDNHDPYVLNGFSPEKAADKVAEVLILDQLRHGTYTEARRAVREVMKRFMELPSNSRQFTSAVMTELEDNFNLKWRGDKDTYAYHDSSLYRAHCGRGFDHVSISITTEGEVTMLPKANTPKLIEKKTFINGVDASTLTDDQIFSVIKQAEAEIEGLELINNKPEKLGKKIAKLQKAIEKVRQYVDER